MPDNTIRFRLLVEDKVSKPLHDLRNEFDKLTGTNGSASFFGNVGAKAVAQGFGLIDRAASGAIGILGDAVTGAIAVEEANTKLQASLKANVPSWNGNTDAIDRANKAGIRLGFTTKDQTDSLALLVAATHDVNKAIEVQHVAMDLARFKSIDLATATEALTRVEGGSFRILKSLGIQLKAGATAQDALNAVEAVAAGQRDVFVTTTGGKMVATQTRINALMDELGAKILPVVSDGLTLLNAGLDAVSGQSSTVARNTLDLQQTLINVARTAAGPLHAAFIDGWLADQQKLHDQATVTVDDLDRIGKAAFGLDKGLDGPIGKLGDVTSALRTIEKHSNQQVQINVDIQTRANNLLSGALAALFGGPPKKHRAAGGPVWPGEAYTVGEHGPETLVMGAQNGTVIPNGVSADSGQPHIIQVVLPGIGVIAEAVDAHNYRTLQRAAPTQLRG